MTDIYTDGGYDPVSGLGGWAAIIIEDGQKRSLSGAVKPPTTGNRMEITAAVEGLYHTSGRSDVTVHTDSQYVFNCMVRGFARRANKDLWDDLDREAGKRTVNWVWVDRNEVNPVQKEAHRLATAAATGSPVPETHKTAVERPPAPAARLSHVDSAGRPRMVDVTAKPDTEREAVASCRIKMNPATFALIIQGKVEKGDVLTTARLAGIMGAKQTPHLIPLCHPILIGNTDVQCRLDEVSSSVEITVTVRSSGKTGVEMEALTAAAITALTIYDMCKAVDRAMVIEDLKLIRKSGGKSGVIELTEWD